MDRWVMFFASSIALLGSFRLWMSLFKTRRVRFWAFPVFGAFTGLLAPVVAVVLMILKAGAHAHPAPDFAPIQLLVVLQRIPVWVLGGILIGLGVSVWRYRGLIWERKQNQAN